ncbi:MAG: hypothetical protein GY857_19530, partial [Desulfobacula sp.]|nr:hypothetical protein [Desulfobacula sp.]
MWRDKPTNGKYPKPMHETDLTPNRFIIFLMVLVVVIFFLTPAHAIVSILGDSAGEISLQRELFLLEDPTKTLSIQDVTKDYAEKFVLNDTGKTSYGYSNSAFWIKFTIFKDHHNSAAWYLKHNYPHLDLVEFYAPKKDGTYALTKTGDTFIFGDRVVPCRLFIFPVFPEETGSTYYLRLSSKGVINFDLSLVDGQ